MLFGQDKGSKGQNLQLDIGSFEMTLTCLTANSSRQACLARQDLCHRHLAMYAGICNDYCKYYCYQQRQGWQALMQHGQPLSVHAMLAGTH